MLDYFSFFMIMTLRNVPLVCLFVIWFIFRTTNSWLNGQTYCYSTITPVLAISTWLWFGMSLITMSTTLIRQREQFSWKFHFEEFISKNSVKKNSLKSECFTEIFPGNQNLLRKKTLTNNKKKNYKTPNIYNIICDLPTLCDIMLK